MWIWLLIHALTWHVFWDHFVNAPGQWETMLQCDCVSHRLGAFTEWSLVFQPLSYSPWWGIKWKHFPRYWPFMRGIHWSPVNSPHKGQWRGALMFSLICAWINGWVNNYKAGDLRCPLWHHCNVLHFWNIDTVETLIVRFRIPRNSI